jgi:hypothetical protein
MPPWLSLSRALALSGVAGLFVVGFLALTMILGAGSEGDGERAASAPTATATATPEPTATPRPEPTPEPLTAAERRQRKAAAEQLRQQGYAPVNLRHYHPDQTLRVLLGDGEVGRRAFFFVGDTFLGTDASESSRKVRIVRQSRTAVTLEYGLSTGDKQRVRFRWNGTALAPETPVPPADQRLG